MPHFYVPPENIHGASFVISGEEAQHIIRVLRYGPGAIICFFDGEGNSFQGRIDAIHDDMVEGSIIAAGQGVKPGASLHLCAAVPRGSRFDWLVEKAVELGVTSLTPIITERSTVKEISPAKSERWERLSVAASKQCGRSDIMAVQAPGRFRDVVASLPSGDRAIIPYEGEEAKTVRESLPVPLSSPVRVFIGPEGGFTREEISFASEHGILPVTLGERILRVETAAILAVILVLERAGEYSRKSS